MTVACPEQRSEHQSGTCASESSRVAQNPDWRDSEVASVAGRPQRSDSIRNFLISAPNEPVEWRHAPASRKIPTAAALESRCLACGSNRRRFPWIRRASRHGDSQSESAPHKPAHCIKRERYLLRRNHHSCRLWRRAGSLLVCHSNASEGQEAALCLNPPFKHASPETAGSFLSRA